MHELGQKYSSSKYLTLEYHSRNGYWGTAKGHIIRIFSNVTDRCIFSIFIENGPITLEQLENLVHEYPNILADVERRFKK